MTRRPSRVYDLFHPQFALRLLFQLLLHLRRRWLAQFSVVIGAVQKELHYHRTGRCEKKDA